MRFRVRGFAPFAATLVIALAPTGGAGPALRAWSAPWSRPATPTILDRAIRTRCVLKALSPPPISRSMPQPPRPVRFEVRFTAAEHAELRSRAHFVGRTLARYIRETALGVVPVVQSRRIEDTALVHLARIGNTLNQLAREAHAAERFPLAGTIEAAIDTVNALAAQIGGVSGRGARGGRRGVS